MDFRYALKVEQIELQEELLWEHPRAFLEDLWSEIKYNLSKLGEVKWNLYRFLERVNEEIQKRNWDLMKFRNGKTNEPINNLFRKIIKEIAKESQISIHNDILSRILNYVRNQYSTEGVLLGGIFPVEAFMKRKEYDLPFDLGDENSCFRQGGSNEGSALWLIEEWKNYQRAWFVVFHYKSKSGKEGIGRCWIYRISEYAIFATNFYSKGVDIRSKILKYSVVKLLRLLFELHEEVRFIFDKDIDLPIYLNGDGLIIYEKGKYSESDEVVEWAAQIQSQCMICKETTKISKLYRYEKEVLYENKEISGLIMCKECLDFYEDAESYHD